MSVHGSCEENTRNRHETKHFCCLQAPHSIYMSPLSSYLLYFMQKTIPVTKIMIRSAATGTKMAIYVAVEVSWLMLSRKTIKIAVSSELFKELHYSF